MSLFRVEAVASPRGFSSPSLPPGQLTQMLGHGHGEPRVKGCWIADPRTAGLESHPTDAGTYTNEQLHLSVEPVVFLVVAVA